MQKDSEIYHHKQRTEQVQHIIERMPTKFGFWVSIIVGFIFTLMFVFGWLVRYPDVVPGQIVINSNISPIKLVANGSGKLKLNGIKSMDVVKEGQIIAYIENPTNPAIVFYIDSMLKNINPSKESILTLKNRLPSTLSLGELNSKYYAFVSSLQEYTNYKYDKLFDKQGQNLANLLVEQEKAMESAKTRVEMANKSLTYAHKFYQRDSTLFKNKVISEAELDKTEMSYIANKDALQAAINNLVQTKQSSQQTEGKIQELDIQKPEKNSELNIKLISAYNDLVDNIKSWEQRYVFRAPFGGKVQFLKFYNENQFLQSGEQVFTIIPNNEEPLGQVVLPANGSGKVKIGQEVIVKLDNYPYMEYGSIKGHVTSISLTTNTEKTEKGDMETYLALVKFDDGLKTNYGKKLDFKAEAKGSAEIITNDRKLIQRLFDNLKYVVNK
ncbi:HlyD family efflux transporter periplasmic adaptor subunit [Pedobacter psychrodurus]|uniref:HlyD family efflux transporter periplasmic adaptor subunit n=1 Tax=Pedobacter psychrodurus TaxID=2530456 RepID=A0A4R0PJS4_9SPHI|nr:HlyD family efflux transporter periplasmic adaptor subunit [Pedobacter psychrodurus]TCD20387.1 HlyD family efflux transporter periplasmic adaptor subunit [Pedobacter psychrodurus]